MNGSLDGEAIITSYFGDNIFSQYRILLSEGKIVLDDRWVKDGDEYFLESEIGNIRMVYNDDILYIAYLGMFDE